MVQLNDSIRVVRLGILESRPIVQLMCVLRFVAGTMWALQSDESGCSAGWPAYIASALAWSCASVSIYLINGAVDGPGDKLNGVGRPVGRGDLKQDDARQFATATAVLAIAIALLSGSYSMPLLVGGYLLIGYAYSVPPVQLNRHLAGASIIVFCGGMLTYLAGAMAVGAAISAELLVFATVMSAWMGAVGAIVKDFSDFAGDSAVRRKTLVCMLGERTVRRIIATSAIGLTCATGLATLRLPALAVIFPPLFIGALAVAYTTLTTRYADPRAVSRRPYHAFMGTQLTVHAAVPVALI
ncbi:UbiA family prenyltransferase [Nocardia sp. NPDC127579]|uniref:UbiA family prenyltransferase n=1 Tax=Nocardia sp. NPDC127579 TaxID=3345402 RepID=UPI0036271F8F